MKVIGDIQVTKFKLKEGGKVAQVEFELFTESGMICQGKTEICDEPHPELIDAFNALLPLAIASHDLDEEQWEQLGCCTGITLKLDDNNTYGVVLTAQKKAAEGTPALVNTPFLKSEEIDQRPIEKLVHEIDQYLEGKRAQGNLLVGVAA